MTEARTVVDRDGRAKAYRPLPGATRREALHAGLAAYREGDFFEAHELLEPAWMGTDDMAERDLLQGLIKLAAAYVHAVRGNPRGIVRNLEGARVRLEAAHRAGSHAPEVDLPRLLQDIDQLLGSSMEAPQAIFEPPIVHPAPRRRP